MDTGAKCLDAAYNGAPWEWQTLGVADPGSSGPWEWRTLGVAGRHPFGIYFNKIHYQHVTLKKCQLHCSSAVI